MFWKGCFTEVDPYTMLKLNVFHDSRAKCFFVTYMS